IEGARQEAAAYVVQRQPVEGAEIGEAEERIVEAVETAENETDSGELEELAEEAEAGRDEIRRELFGPGSGRQ
ncbi:MAG: hypothetical protein M3253_08575, partial [Chloroflexota bacterium]|nr:hypothetical protein [Chloroflexota bacterium]